MSQFQVFDYSTASIPSNPGTIWFFRDEWETKQRICKGTRVDPKCGTA